MDGHCGRGDLQLRSVDGEGSGGASRLGRGYVLRSRSAVIWQRWLWLNEGVVGEPQRET